MIENSNLDINRLEIAMANACMNYAQLAKITGMTAETISKIKNGKQNPRPATIGRIAKALNVDYKSLLPMDCSNQSFTRTSLSEYSTRELLEEIERRCQQ